MTVEELQAVVDERYDALDLPCWPDPHPGSASPAEDEYSRVTDPDRYRIVQARARLWADVLVDVLGARAEEVDPASVPTTLRVARGVRLAPPRRDALPLLLLESGDAVVVAVTRPEIEVTIQPDCGCDACDSGSTDLLEAVDLAVRWVVGGPFVVLRGQGWEAAWHPGGGSARNARGRRRFEELMDLCRRLAEGERVRLPRRTEALVGHSWLA